MRRVFFAVLASAVLLAPGAPAAAASPLPVTIAGHWSCMGGADGPAERSYLMDGAAIIGRSDAPRADDGGGSTTWERVEPNADGTLASQSVEGDATGAIAGDGSLQLHGAGNVNIPAFDLRYTVVGDTLQRATTTRGKTTVERCTREAPAAPLAGCAVPNVPARILRVAEPSYPAPALAAHAAGTVFVIIRLDDRSQLVWTRVFRSDSPLLDEATLQAARASTYQTEIRDCKPTSADYVFSAQFSMGN